MPGAHVITFSWLQEPETEEVKEEEDVDEDGLCEYEREREARIARNRERLAALQLPGLAQRFAAQHAKPNTIRPRGLAANKRKKASAAILIGDILLEL